MTGTPARGSRRPLNRPILMSTVLDAYLETSGLKAGLARTEAVKDWPEAVGARIAQISRAVEVQGEVLVVEVSSSAWLNELSLMRREILARINEGAERPPINRLLFRLAQDGTGTASTRGR